MKRCIAFCLALGAAISLTACGGGDTEGGLLCEASGIRPDTVLLSVDGRDVSAQRYLYWLAYACDYIADYYDSGEGIQWGDTVSGQSLEDYAKDQALQNAALYATVETWAEDYGCTLTDEDRTAMDREWAARAAQYGGEEAYLAVLARMGLDRAEAEAISGDYYLYEHLYDLYCTEGSELAPAEHDLETFAQEQGYLTVDHIWLSTAAADPADAEAVAACRARAEEAFSKLNGSADPAHDFAVLAATYSDETDRDQHPSGYTFTVGDGTLPAACEEAAQALEEGQFSGVVEADDGFYLILRKHVDLEAVAPDYFDALLQAAADSADISTTRTYADLDVSRFYDERSWMPPAERLPDGCLCQFWQNDEIRRGFDKVLTNFRISQKFALTGQEKPSIIKSASGWCMSICQKFGNHVFLLTNSRRHPQLVIGVCGSA